MVMIVPDASTLRTRWLLESAMIRLPLGSTATAKGELSWAAVAGPPSPPKPATPVPATVVTVPPGLTRLMRWLSASARKRLPLPSKAMPRGRPRAADTAGPPSPRKATSPSPATVVMSRADPTAAAETAVPVGAGAARSPTRLEDPAGTSTSAALSPTTATTANQPRPRRSTFTMVPPPVLDSYGQLVLRPGGR